MDKGSSNPSSTGQYSTRAFTLVELLVVLALIAVLLSMLMPIFNQLRGASEVTQCVANQQQIAAAMLMYARDNDGRFHRQDQNLSAGDNPNTVTYAFWNAMLSYGVAQNSMFCPLQPPESVATYRMFWFPMWGYGLWVPRYDTGYNGGFFPPNVSNGRFTVVDPTGNVAGPTSLSDPRISIAPIVTDVAVSVYGIPASGRITDPMINWNGLPGGYYHRGRQMKVMAMNEAYGDGHVEQVQPQDVRVRYVQWPFVVWR